LAYADAAKTATITVAAFVVVTVILVPIVTAWVAKLKTAQALDGRSGTPATKANTAKST
jgi:hypothetical protein